VPLCDRIYAPATYVLQSQPLVGRRLGANRAPGTFTKLLIPALSVAFLPCQLLAHLVFKMGGGTSHILSFAAETLDIRELDQECSWPQFDFYQETEGLRPLRRV
jgi:hypothetical protein